MASISSKHAYRFGYLKSEHWQCLRAKKLARERGHCSICFSDAWGNDVHHIEYPKRLYDTTVAFLRVLCRRCHDAVHEIMDTDPKVKCFYDRKTKWKYIKRKAKELIDSRLPLGRPINRKSTHNSDRAKAAFRQARGRLYYGENAVIKKWEMPWSDALVGFFLSNPAASDQEWLNESQRLDGWKSVWPQGDH